MPWVPIDPAQAQRERMRRRAVEAARPKNHNRAYKRAEWLRLRLRKLTEQPLCEFCMKAQATEVDHINGNPWDNRWANLRSACKPCHSAHTMREKVLVRRVGRRHTSEAT